jgi:hypothetical protein
MSLRKRFVTFTGPIGRVHRLLGPDLRFMTLTAVMLAVSACIAPVATTPVLEAEVECRAPESPIPESPIEVGGGDVVSSTLTVSDTTGVVAANAENTEAAADAVWNMVNCWNDGNANALITLWTPHFLESQFGITDTETAQYALANLPPIAIDSLTNVQSYGDEVLSIDVLYRREVGQHMLVHEQWFFRKHGEWLLLDTLLPLPVAIEGPKMDVAARLAEGTLEIDQTTFTAGGTVVFHVTNEGSQPHEFAVFRPPQELGIVEIVEEIVTNGELPKGTAITGATFAMPGQQATDLVLVNLEPGNYLVVCNLRGEDGVSHLESREVTVITVAE